MLGRKTYTPDELGQAKTAVCGAIAAYRTLIGSLRGNAPCPEVAAAIDVFEPVFLNNMTLVLDRYFVHRLRVVSGKDGNPLNEVELLTDSLMSNDGVLRGNNVIKYDAGTSVLKLSTGDRIRLTAPEFERLASAFFIDIESKFL